MKHLIILRGPAGSGKTSVSRNITELVGKDNACILDLDITHPQEDKFNHVSKEYLVPLSCQNNISHRTWDFFQYQSIYYVLPYLDQVYYLNDTDRD